MIATIEKIQDDELFASWLSFVLEENGAKSLEDKNEYLYAVTHDDMYSNLKHTFRPDYFENLDEICRCASKGSRLFPELTDIVQKHTDLFAMLPLWTKDEQAKRYEFNIYGSGADAEPFRGYPVKIHRKICPLCAKEDLDLHGRIIIHVPHMLHVDTCWKHGCRLVDEADWKDDMIYENPMPATKQETQMAKFMHDLYLKPVVTSFEQTYRTLRTALALHGITRKEACGMAVDAGYLNSETNVSSFLISSIHAPANYYAVNIGVMTWLYGTADNFRKDLPVLDPANEYTRNDMELISNIGPLAKFRCKTCGHEFYMHVVSAECGMPCPICRKEMTDIEIWQRYADFLDDGEYEIFKDDDGEIHAVHKQCGQDRTRYFGKIVHNHAPCPNCRLENEIKSHVGERKMNNHGAWMEITGGRDMYDLDICFDDGFTAHGRSYKDFLNGAIRDRTEKGRNQERVGEEKFNTSVGMNMHIKAYRGIFDVDIEFEDGAVAEHREYQAFQNGTTQYPEQANKKLHDERIGMENVNYQGMKMKITEYRLTSDITVEFETGDKIHSSFYSFVRGDIGCPSLYRLTGRVGEEGYNTKGQKMRIVRYGNAGDIDIAFENGYTSYHKSYACFKKGYITCRDPQESDYDSEGRKIELREQRIGMKKTNFQGIEMEITDYSGTFNVEITFETGDVVHTCFDRFKKGRIKCPSVPLHAERIGEEGYNSHGQHMRILNYRGPKDIDVVFDNGYIAYGKAYSKFKIGYIPCGKPPKDK